MMLCCTIVLPLEAFLRLWVLCLEVEGAEVVEVELAVSLEVWRSVAAEGGQGSGGRGA